MRVRVRVGVGVGVRGWLQGEGLGLGSWLGRGFRLGLEGGEAAVDAMAADMVEGARPVGSDLVSGHREADVAWLGLGFGFGLGIGLGLG